MSKTEKEQNREAFSFSDGMNLLTGVTLLQLAKAHPSHPAELNQEDTKFTETREKLVDYREKVLKYYEKHPYTDLRVEKINVFLGYLSDLAEISNEKKSFEGLFADDGAFVAAAFYSELSRTHRSKMLPGFVSKDDLRNYLFQMSKKYLRNDVLEDPRLQWLQPIDSEKQA